MNNYDVIVIGAGPGGKNVALNLAKKGKSVCLIEKSDANVGGTCLNEGCIPAKLYLESASFLGKKSYFESCGLIVKDVDFDMSVLKNKKTALLTQLRSSAITNIKKAKINLVIGSASFNDENSVIVNGEVLKADKYVIASGSVHRPHPLLELDGDKIISSKEVFELENTPKSILVVGGGAIGCEFATFFHSLGSEVHIAEFTPNLVPAEDEDVAKTLKRELERKGIKITLNANVTSFETNEKGITITMDTPKGETITTYEKVLVSIGRSPNTSELNLKSANIKSERGFITISDELLTTNPNVYAIGDVIPTPALAHSAYNEANIVANNITNSSICKPSKIIPFVTFCHPQVASVGLNEKMLKAANIEYDATKQFFKSSAKAKIKGDDGGFIKLLSDKKSGVILGCSMIGNDVTELIHEILIAINAKQTKEDLAKMVFAHPTLSESIWDMVK